MSIEGTYYGWFDPARSYPKDRECVVEGCGQASHFSLCPNHAVPGWVFESGGAWFVGSLWLVERDGHPRLISLNDFALGDLFGSREAFEAQLVSQGYTVRHLISSPEQLKTAKRKNPGVLVTLWTPTLPDDEDAFTPSLHIQDEDALANSCFKLRRSLNRSN